jgi:hypothetical protein
VTVILCPRRGPRSPSFLTYMIRAQGWDRTVLAVETKLLRRDGAKTCAALWRRESRPRMGGPLIDDARARMLTFFEIE